MSSQGRPNFGLIFSISVVVAGTALLALMVLNWDLTGQILDAVAR